MSASVKCPTCHTPHTQGDAQPGTMLLCDSCGEVFDAGPAAPAPAQLPWPNNTRKAAPADDEQKRSEAAPQRSGGSPVLALTIAAIVLLFILGGLGFGVWYIATSVNDMVADSSEPEKPEQPKPPRVSGDPGAGKIEPWRPGNGGPKGQNPPVGPPGGGVPPPVPPPPKKKVDTFELRPAEGKLPPITAADVPPEGQTVVLPGAAGAVTVGGGGRYVVMHFPQQSRLSVFDVSRGEIVSSASVESGGAHVAAGADRMVLHIKGKLLAYTLPDLRPLFEGKGPYVHGISGMAMGSRTNGPLLMVDPFGTVVLSDVSGDQMREIEGSQKQPGVYAVTPRVSADGRMFVFTETHFNNQSVLLTESARTWSAIKADLRGGTPSWNGGYVFGDGKIVDSRGEPVPTEAAAGTRSWYVPATSGDYFAKLTEEKTGKFPRQKVTYELTVHTDPKADKPAVAALGPIPELAGLVDSFRGTTVPLNIHLILVPEAKVLVVLNRDRTKLILRKVELR